MLLVNPVLFLVLKILVWTNRKQKKEGGRNTYTVARHDASEDAQNFGAATVLYHSRSPFSVELLRCCYSCNIKERYFMDAT